MYASGVFSFELTMQVRNSKYEMYRHVIVWIDLPSQTCWQCKYIRNCAVLKWYISTLAEDGFWK
jgi:hypothetical protein